jgi:hypothetical protein
LSVLVSLCPFVLRSLFFCLERPVFLLFDPQFMQIAYAFIFFLRQRFFHSHVNSFHHLLVSCVSIFNVFYCFQFVHYSVSERRIGPFPYQRTVDSRKIASPLVSVDCMWN